MIKLLALDMDDTLYLESEYVISGFAAAAKCLSDERESQMFMRHASVRFSQGERGNIFNNALTDIGVADSDTLISKMLETYRAHAPDIQLSKDADNLLTVAKGTVATALVSDGYLPAQKKKAEALGLYNRIDHILLTETLGRDFWKPHPKAFQILEGHFSVSEQDCVYVGDNPTKDFDAPKKLGWRTVRIRRTGGLHSSLPDKEGSVADHTIQTLNDLLAILEQ